MAKSVIHWFRKGLRLHDNPSLIEAINSKLELYPIFILDPWFVKNARVGENRWRFLQQSLSDLDANLRELGSRLFVIRGSPESVFKKIFPAWKVSKLTFEIDTEPYAKHRDALVQEIAKQSDVEVVTKVSHTLYDTQIVIERNKGSPPLTYQKLQSLLRSIGPPPKSVDSPTVLPAPCLISDGDIFSDKIYDVPTLTELQVDTTALEDCKFPGGETEGLKRLNEFICERNGIWVRGFEKPNTSPNSLSPSTTVLSPYLKFGCISPRLMYEKLIEINQKGKHSLPPVSLVGQLLWREFFYVCGSSINKFDKMVGNPICRQIPWETNQEYLSAWKAGETGYPFIDAIMTQLRKEGWIHHLARHAVACFLTRGDLWISWEEGLKVFEEYLLDADWSLNAGNWMWLSASAFFHQYFRVYSPISFGKKTDPSGEYIKKYLPQLRKFPERFIFEPWKAPKDVQEKAGCIIGKDYPKPIVDHSAVSKTNMAKMKLVYEASKKKETNRNMESASKKKKTHKNINSIDSDTYEPPEKKFKISTVNEENKASKEKQTLENMKSTSKKKKSHKNMRSTCIPRTENTKITKYFKKEKISIYGV